MSPEESSPTGTNGNGDDHLLLLNVANQTGVLSDALSKPSYLGVGMRSFSVIETENPRTAWITLQMNPCTEKTLSRIKALIGTIVTIGQRNVHDLHHHPGVQVRQHVRMRVDCFNVRAQKNIAALVEQYGGRLEVFHTQSHIALTAHPHDIARFKSDIRTASPEHVISRTNPPIANFFDLEREIGESNENRKAPPDTNYVGEWKDRHIVVVTLARAKTSLGNVEALLDKVSSRGKNIATASQVDVDPHTNIVRLTLHIQGCDERKIDQVIAQIRKEPAVIKADLVRDSLTTQHAIVRLTNCTDVETAKASIRENGKIVFSIENDVLGKITGTPKIIAQQLNTLNQQGDLRFGRFAPIAQLEGGKSGL